MPQIKFKDSTLKSLSADKTTWFTDPGVKGLRLPAYLGRMVGGKENPEMESGILIILMPKVFWVMRARLSKNGRPDFSQWSKGEIEFEPGVLDGSDADFTQVYEQIKVAKGYQLVLAFFGLNSGKDGIIKKYGDYAERIGSPVVPVAEDGLKRFQFQLRHDLNRKRAQHSIVAGVFTCRGGATKCENALGNLFVFDPALGAVLFWHHDSQEGESSPMALTLVSNSFDEFVSGLEPFDDPAPVAGSGVKRVSLDF